MGGHHGLFLRYVRLRTFCIALYMCMCCVGFPQNKWVDLIRFL